MNLIKVNEQLTMSSREIADITGKSHSKVMRDIRTMIESLERSPDLDYACNDSFYTSESSGQKYPCYELDRDTTECLLTGYSAVLRMKVIKRWKDLEAAQKPKLPGNYKEALIALVEAEEEKEQLALERDRAIETKAHINSKRTATVMGKLGAATKKIKTLEDKLQDVGDYLSELAAKLPKRVDTPMRDNVQTWRLLKQLSSDMQLPPKKVKDSRYGEVNAYHVDVIDRFKDLYL